MDSSIFNNPVLFAGLFAWGFAQALKLPLDYLINRRWNWVLLVSAGGMPSSHSSLVTATALAVGIFDGFHSPLFGVTVALAMIVIYDATGIRRQAGIHAQKINIIFNELLSGHPVSEAQLKEVLGHTPLEALSGIGIGTLSALIATLIWR